jgi:hypothetical protein
MMDAFPVNAMDLKTAKGDPSMAKVYGLHEIELRPGADPAAFEQLVASAAELENLEGWTSYLLKGERGERKGKYMLLFEIESLAARDRYAPDSGPSAELVELIRQAASFWERWRELATSPAEDTVFTDYVVVR